MIALTALTAGCVTYPSQTVPVETLLVQTAASVCMPYVLEGRSVSSLSERLDRGWRRDPQDPPFIAWFSSQPPGPIFRQKRPAGRMFLGFNPGGQRSIPSRRGLKACTVSVGGADADRVIAGLTRTLERSPEFVVRPLAGVNSVFCAVRDGTPLFAEVDVRRNSNGFVSIVVQQQADPQAGCEAGQRRWAA
jgi:hypothetical protein